MGGRSMELTDRKKQILRAIVDSYIRTAEPVGSKTISQMPGMDFSPATIRNEMADLHMRVDFDVAGQRAQRGGLPAVCRRAYAELPPFDG